MFPRGLSVLGLLLLPLLAAPPALAVGVETLDLGTNAGTPQVPIGEGICTVEPFAPGPGLIFNQDGYNKVYFGVRLSDCSACPAPQMLQLNSITITTRTLVACTFQVEVSVVGATAGACPAPDESDVICPPTLVDVVVPGSATYTPVIPLPAGCCITKDAFVCLRFIYDDCLNAGAIQGPPIRNTASAPCEPCRTFFSTNVDFPNITDWCTAFPAADYNLWSSIDADCCDPTPTHDHSWGRVKQLYR